MSEPYLSEKEKKVLDIDDRRSIYSVVCKYPGIHFREIERKSRLSTGSTQYHLDYLTKKGLLEVQKEGNLSRYYSKEFNSENKRLLGLLRQGSIRKILIFVLENPKCTHEELVKFTNLAPSTMSWYVKKLQEKSILGAKKEGRFRHYTLLIDKEDLLKMLVTYQESFVDKLVDNVVEMWDT